MEEYDPLQAPDSEEWLELDEGDQILLVKEYHTARKIEVPNLDVHAAIHATVETQLAANDPPQARRALARMMAEGLDRHDAVHAVGSVLAELMFDLMKKDPSGDPNEAYSASLDRLTAESWRAI